MNTYRIGDAIDTRSNRKLSIIIVAEEKEALSRYRECIKRHPELKSVDNPNIAILVNVDELLNDLGTDEIKNELNRFDSAPI